MGYFVTNKGQGPGSNTGRGANPQLDSALLLISLVTPELFKLLKGVVKRSTSVAAAGDILLCHLCPPQSDVQVRFLLQAAMLVWRNLKRILLLVALSNFLNDAVKQCYFE